MQQLINKENSAFLVYTIGGKIVGCLNLQKKHEKIYLGMFSVSPALQNAGIGKKLLTAAENYSLANRCNIIYMTIISVRHQLIKWYQRHGYIDKQNKPAIFGRWN